MTTDNNQISSFDEPSSPPSGRKMYGRKKIVRRKPGDTSPRKVYFDESTQDAIVRFQQEKDLEKQKAIYTLEINPAFDALVENLINVYKFQTSYESKADLKLACVQDLFLIIRKYDPTRASKAFSYFNVVAKHWLTIRSKNNAKMMKNFMSLDNMEAFNSHELDVIENYNVIPACDDVTTHEDYRASLTALMEELKNRSKTDNEQACVDAISILIDSSEEIDLINKRAVMAYMREITKLSPKQLSVVLSSLKKYYKDIRKNSENLIEL